MPNGGLQEVSAVTTDGLVAAGLTPARPGDMRVTVRSGDLEWTAGRPIAVSRSAAKRTVTATVPASVATGGGGDGFPVALVDSLAGAVALVGAVLASALYWMQRRWQAAAPNAGSPLPSIPTCRNVDAPSKKSCESSRPRTAFM